MFASDTSADAARVQRSVLAGKSGDERTSMAFEMSELVYELTLDGIRRREPHLSGSDLTIALIERMHGPVVAQAVADSGLVAGGS